MENTTENTATEAGLTPIQFAEQFIKEHNASEIAEELVSYSKSVDSLKEQLEYMEKRWRVANTSHHQLKDAMTDFIKEHVSHDDSASVDELKELAEELGIELTKEITVHFTVTYDITIEVALDEEVSDDDFSVDMSYNGDGEVTNEEADWSSVVIEEEE